MDDKQQYLANKEFQANIKEAKALIVGTDLKDKQDNLIKFLETHVYCVELVSDFKLNNDWNIIFLKSLHEKLIFTSSSIIELSKGFILKSKGLEQEILDTPSMMILKRSVIECFLTMEYLYYNELSQEEKEFRFKLYIHAGLLARHNQYNYENMEYLEKFRKEAKIIEKLKSEIVEYSFYKDIKKGQRWKFNKFGLSRLESWDALIKNSSLNTSLFSKQYALSTNYAHSEFISAMQMREGDYNISNSETNKNAELEMDILRMINSLSIRKLTNMFHSSKNGFEKLNHELKLQINTWANIASGTYS